MPKFKEEITTAWTWYKSLPFWTSVVMALAAGAILGAVLL